MHRWHALMRQGFDGGSRRAGGFDRAGVDSVGDAYWFRFADFYIWNVVGLSTDCQHMRNPVNKTLRPASLTEPEKLYSVQMSRSSMPVYFDIHKMSQHS